MSLLWMDINAEVTENIREAIYQAYIVAKTQHINVSLTIPTEVGDFKFFLTETSDVDEEFAGYEELRNTLQRAKETTKEVPPRPVWLSPKQYTPPRSAKLHLLTVGGISTTGFWSDADCVGWMPLADTPEDMKKDMLKWATGDKDWNKEWRK